MNRLQELHDRIVKNYPDEWKESKWEILTFLWFFLGLGTMLAVPWPYSIVLGLLAILISHLCGNRIELDGDPEE